MTMAKEKKRRQRKKNDFFYVAKHIRFPWHLIILAMVVGMAQSVIAGAIPDATANLFDGDFNPAKLLPVVEMLLSTLALAVITRIITVHAEAKSALVARRAAWELMINSKTKYYDENDPGALLSMVTIDAQTMGVGISQLFTAVPTALVLVLVSAIQIFSYSPKLLMVLLVIIPMHIIYMAIVGRWQMRLGKKIYDDYGELTGYLSERIKNLPLIKSFCAEKLEEQNGLDAAEKIYDINGRGYGKLGFVIHAYQTLSVVAANVITVLWGCFLLRSGDIDVPTFLGFTMYIATISASFMVVSIIWGYIKDFQGRAFRYARLLESPTEGVTYKHVKMTKENKRIAKEVKWRAKKGNISSVVPEGPIIIENLSFAYNEKDGKVLSNVNLTIPQNKVTAIVGPSGSGKTTIIKLLERLYEPTDGRITISHRDIQDLDINAWRNKISYVVQDAGVFSGTIREALCYGVEREVTQAEIDSVAKRVGLYSFIQSLPEKYETELASWAGSVSGGQRQRIVIARALLRNSDIYIFDEPTSALDPDAAKAISNMIFNEFKSKTLIIISHELSYIARADKIAVLHNGKLEGAGTHEALMAGCPVYADLVKEQSYKEVFR